MASRFASNKLVIFDTNNEYHDMDNTLVAQLNQAAINGIRAAGATSQYIFVEGNSYSGAWTWVHTFFLHLAAHFTRANISLAGLQRHLYRHGHTD